MAGCGGNVVAFARHQRCQQVVAVDVNEDRLAACTHNAAIYGVADKVKTVCGDFFDIAPSLQVRFGSTFGCPPSLQVPSLPEM